ncbi:MAG: hypothetical protein E7426_05395 [Ruminococcaceae bacterium]|nr:hypothetical protein [Oscillospiraceae bacterium]
MKRILHWLIPAALLVIMFGGAYLFTHVSGSRIRGVPELTSGCLAEIHEIPWSGDTRGVESVYKLDTDQIRTLQRLLEHTRLARTLADSAPLESVFYHIFVTSPDGELVLSLYVNDGRYILVSDQFWNRYLKIKNEKWLEELQTILAAADQS